MLIYSGTKEQFDNDVLSGCIANKIEHEFYKHGVFHKNDREYVSWENSLSAMQKVLDDDVFSKELNVAVEYQIPMTSKRVDFLIAGENDEDKEHVVVVELKQWEEAGKTNCDGIVTAFTGGMVRTVAHPSYQAYSYAKTIENFNQTVQDDHIEFDPCAYLHNYKKSKLFELTDELYSDVIKEAPVFIKNDEEKLRNFIKKYVRKPSKRNLLYVIENGKIRPSKALQDSLVSMLDGNEEFVMIDEQKVVYEKIKELTANADNDGQKVTVIVEGGPGTGKSVVAIQLLSYFISEKRYNACYVTKNSAPRNVYFEKLKKGNYKQNYIKFLFQGSGTFVDSKNNEFDCLLVDEAHRLNEKSGMFKNKGENQVKEIINAARVSVFFIDEDQRVTASDIGSVEEIKKWAEICNSKLYYGEETQLSSQFRCNGSDAYISFLNNLFQIKSTANTDVSDLDYDIKVYDNPRIMREDLRLLNNINNKTRMLAGYCYEWRSKNSNDLSVYDIEIGSDFKARWNFNTTTTWAIDADSFDQVGCIHTAQGLEFDYIGVIIGKDLSYKDGKVITDFTMRASSDKSLNGLIGKCRKGDEDALVRVDRIIRCTYRTLMTRGQKGCYIYCEDRELGEYIKNSLSQTRI